VRLVLASRSPQRRAILEQLGVSFAVVVSDAPELLEGDPVEVAVENARRKARAVLSSATVLVRGRDATAGQDTSERRRSETAPAAPAASPSPPVVGVDTVVALDGVLYGKPRDEAEARATLEQLSGRVHEVTSGIAVAEAGEVRTAHATTRVRFRELDRGTLDWYVATGEWRERAGGYAIQGRGAALVAGIEGDYLNVVGLPVPALLGLLPGILHRDF
jgi:nucleoside triphosphate pyrophosphatase